MPPRRSPTDVYRPISIGNLTSIVLLTGTDGSGTRAHRPEHRNHYNAIFVHRWLPEHASTTPPRSTARLAATKSNVQWALERDWVQRDLGPDSTICVLQHTRTAPGEQVRIGTTPPSPTTGPKLRQPRSPRASLSPLILFRLHSLDVGLLQSVSRQPSERQRRQETSRKPSLVHLALDTSTRSLILCGRCSCQTLTRSL